MNIVRRVVDQVEFFTIEATGESGVSVSGLARLCGVNQTTVTKLTQRVMNGKAPKRLKRFEGMDLALITGSKYKNATIYTAEYCAAVIKHYAFEGREIAEYSLEEFATDGVNAWIQKITGWTAQKTEQKQLKDWEKRRLSGKTVRRELTDAIASYIDRHPELSLKTIQFLYPNTSDCLNIKVFGKRSKALKKERGISKSSLLRDTFNLEELYNVKRIEDVAIKLIDEHDVYPPNAIIEAMDRMLISAK